MEERKPFEIGGESIGPGSRRTVDIPVSVLSDHTPVTMSVHVVHGRRAGPTLFVSAAVHGDEIIGVEILRRLLRTKSLDRLRGTLLAIPVVNSFGFLNRSRYLPDRRDLNRSFPGLAKGSLAGRLAHIFMNEIVARSDFGIDLHSAAVNRTNLPQLRVSPSQPSTMEWAKAFGAPLLLHSKIRDGSLRSAAKWTGIDVLVYEAGEALRFDEFSVRTGVAGILRVMHAMGMVASKGVPKLKINSIRSTSSYWVRAPAGGMLRSFKTTGEEVEGSGVLGMISDPFGESDTDVTAEDPGLLIGRTNLPVVNEGDAVFHVARIKQTIDAESTIDALANHLEEDPLFDEDEII
ncbi:MAG: succinylglutamate desuccinylase/aspartoacylase family protein [Gammaproteobacteria bacterium]|nr:succinylglutamate desuccinylase/aspartoacylase family protein [Gammaproteobacteria bacterium]